MTATLCLPRRHAAARLARCVAPFGNTSHMSSIRGLLANGWPSLRRAAATLLAVGAGWLLFEFVIGDARLFLDYLKILAWPLVVLVALSFFRAPLEDRFRHLLRIEGPGLSAEFSAAAQGRLLQEDIGDDVDSLLGGGARPVADDDPAENASDDADADPTHEQDGGPAGDPARESSGSEAAKSNAPEPEARGGLGPVAVEELLELVQAFRVPKDVVDTALRGASDPGDTEPLKKLLRTEAMRLRRLEKQAAERRRETRESLEAVIQKSASWGYDMGRAGAPKAVPDVEWSEDGSWRITTAIPAATAAPRQPNTTGQDGTDWHRHVKALEDEIKGLERKRHSPLAITNLSAFGDDDWLKELKRRLRSIDPGNPWA